jgi:hypothetical protein
VAATATSVVALQHRVPPAPGEAVLLEDMVAVLVEYRRIRKARANYLAILAKVV